MKHIVLLGGGHAHMLPISHISKMREAGADITLVQPEPYYYYSGMGPGLLSGIYETDQVRFNTRQIVRDQGGGFIRDSARCIDPARKTVILQSGRSVTYDILSCNVGSFVPREIVEPGATDVFPVKPIENLLRVRRRIEEMENKAGTSAAVVGGGPAAVEIAANLRHLLKQHSQHAADISVFAGHRLLNGYPHALQTKAKDMLYSRGIGIVEEGYVQHCSSPYLLQHADNPVAWHPWDAEAITKARTEDKPIFLSIGYATCHWCHVMARESFQYPNTAAVLNTYFVPIKVDR